jgi:hypothetical protein
MKSFIKQNIFIRQCDLNNLSPFVCEGDISERNITFVVRASKGMPDIDVIKKIYLTGNPGSSTLTVTYNALGGISVIDVIIKQADTVNLTLEHYFYTIISQDPADSTDTVTLYFGDLFLSLAPWNPADSTLIIPTILSNVVIYQSGTTAEMAAYAATVTGAPAGSILYFCTQQDKAFTWNGASFV